MCKCTDVQICGCAIEHMPTCADIQVNRTGIIGNIVEMLSEEPNNSTVMQTTTCNKWNDNEQHDLTIFEIILLANFVFRIDTDVYFILMQSPSPPSLFDVPSKEVLTKNGPKKPEGPNGPNSPDF